MKVLVFPVGKNPEAREIDGSLESWQKIVGGYVENTQAIINDCNLGKTYVLFCNEDGFMKELPLNRGYLGDFFITKVDYGDGTEEPKFLTIPDKAIKAMVKIFSI